MSKESIIKELPESFVLQMRSWVITRSNVGLYTITPAYEGMPGNPIYGSRVLADFTEVSMLERSIESLKPRYFQAVTQFWIKCDDGAKGKTRDGNDLLWLGRRLGCHWETVEARVRKGHNDLRNDLAKREASFERRHAVAY